MSKQKKHGGARKRTKFKEQSELLLRRDDLRESLMFRCNMVSDCNKRCTYRVLNQLVDPVQTLRDLRSKRFQGATKRFFSLCFLAVKNLGKTEPMRFPHPGVKLFFVVVPRFLTEKAQTWGVCHCVSCVCVCELHTNWLHDRRE